MTPDQLLDLSPAQLDAMTDEELSVHLAPIIPLVRATFAGKAESTIVLAPDKRASKRVMQQKLDMLTKYIEMQKESAATVTESTPS